MDQSSLEKWLIPGLGQGKILSDCQSSLGKSKEVLKADGSMPKLSRFLKVPISLWNITQLYKE